MQFADTVIRPAISTACLQERGASAECVKKFRAIFGQGCAVTPETFSLAANAGLDVEWAAIRLVLNEAGRKAYYEMRRKAAGEYLAAGPRAWGRYRDAKRAALFAVVFGLPAE